MLVSIASKVPGRMEAAAGRKRPSDGTSKGRAQPGSPGHQAEQDGEAHDAWAAGKEGGEGCRKGRGRRSSVGGVHERGRWRDGAAQSLEGNLAEPKP